VLFSTKNSIEVVYLLSIFALFEPSKRKLSKMTTRFKLNTGAEIPAIGFGTWQDADSQEAAVAEAIKAGYRHIDTARV
jgi:hypothetical protein